MVDYKRDEELHFARLERMQREADDAYLAKRADAADAKKFHAKLKRTLARELRKMGISEDEIPNVYGQIKKALVEVFRKEEGQRTKS
jgi:hypothetical protein